MHAKLHESRTTSPSTMRTGAAPHARARAAPEPHRTPEHEPHRSRTARPSTSRTGAAPHARARAAPEPHRTPEHSLLALRARAAPHSSSSSFPPRVLPKRRLPRSLRLPALSLARSLARANAAHTGSSRALLNLLRRSTLHRAPAWLPPAARCADARGPRRLRRLRRLGSAALCSFPQSKRSLARSRACAIAAHTGPNLSRRSTLHLSLAARCCCCSSDAD
jgi:hypothetical protein